MNLQLNTLIENIDVILILFFLAIFFKYITNLIEDIKNEYRRKLLFSRAEYVITIYENKRHIAFNSLYKRKLSVLYTSNTTTNKSEQILKYEKTFIHIVRELCGPTIFEDLRDIYGDTNSIVRDLSEYYSTKIITIEAGNFEMELKEKFANDLIDDDDPDSKPQTIFIR
jgi:hypothetical protein